MRNLVEIHFRNQGLHLEDAELGFNPIKTKPGRYAVNFNVRDTSTINPFNLWHLRYLKMQGPRPADVYLSKEFCEYWAVCKNCYKGRTECNCAKDNRKRRRTDTASQSSSFQAGPPDF